MVAAIDDDDFFEDDGAFEGDDGVVMVDFDPEEGERPHKRRRLRVAEEKPAAPSKPKPYVGVRGGPLLAGYVK